MKKWILIIAIFVVVGGGLTACASNSGSASNGIQIREAWARPGQAGGNSAIYFVIENGGDADTLLSASTDAAETAELHISKMDGDKMIMEHQEQVAVPGNGSVEFKPGGLHVMLLDLKNDIQPGDELDLTLTFEKAGAVQIGAPVKEP